MEGENYFGHPWEDNEEDEVQQDISPPLPGLTRQYLGAQVSRQWCNYGSPEFRVRGFDRQGKPFSFFSAPSLSRLIKAHDALARLEVGLSSAHAACVLVLLQGLAWLRRPASFLTYSAGIYRFDLALRQANITGLN